MPWSKRKWNGRVACFFSSLNLITYFYYDACFLKKSWKWPSPTTMSNEMNCSKSEFNCVLSICIILCKRHNDMRITATELCVVRRNSFRVLSKLIEKSVPSNIHYEYIEVSLFINRIMLKLCLFYIIYLIAYNLVWNSMINCYKVGTSKNI